METRMNKFFCLIFDGRNDSGMTVSHIINADAACKVEILATFDISHDCAASLLNEDGDGVVRCLGHIFHSLLHQNFVTRHFKLLA